MITMTLCLWVASLTSVDDSVKLLETMARRLASWEGVEWEVVREESDVAPTHILATRRPFRFRVSRGPHEPGSSIVIGDEEHCRAFDAAGVVTAERPTFATEARDVVSVLNAAHADFAATWQVVLDPEYLRTAARDGQVLDAGRDDIGGEACRVLLLNRAGRHEVYGHFHIAHTIWISDESGLPRASQQLRRMRGRARLGPRFEIRGLRRIEPRDELFTIDGVTNEPPRVDPPPLESSPRPSPVDWVDRELSDVALQDPRGGSVRLSELRGTPLVVTFWATWCAPCLAEFPHLEALQTKHADRLRVVAIATRDARLNVLDWIEKNEPLAFAIWMDADLRGDNTPMTEAFDLDGAIPVSLLVDAHGKVVDRWRGYRDESFWNAKVEALLERD